IVASPSCFLLCYGMRRYLPSFPTRRSSDLRLAVVVLVVPGAAVLRPIQKPHVVRHNLRHPPPATVLRGVAPVLHPPFDGHQAALVQVVGARLGQLSPRHDGEKVGLAFALLMRDGPVHGDAESGHRVALWSVAEVWIRRQAADENHTI